MGEETPHQSPNLHVTST
jgi:hypothetical protein